MKPGKLIDWFDAYCNPKKNTTVQHELFYERNKGELRAIAFRGMNISIDVLSDDYSFYEILWHDIGLSCSGSKRNYCTKGKALKIALAYEMSKAQMKRIIKEMEEIQSVNGGIKK